MLHRRLLDLSLAAAALALGALASPWAAAAGADVAQVTVVSPGGAQQTLSLDALAGSEDVRDRAYALRSGSGESSQTVTGFSLARILDAAGADPYAFSFLEVQRPAGGAVLLSREQALSSAGDGPSAIYAAGSGTGFIRPSTTPEDLNAGDSFTAPQGIAIVLRKGTHLKVRATASTRHVHPDQRVRFSAIVEQAAAGELLTYSWYFDDGSSAGGPEASHAFAKPGSYDVVVGITTPGNDTGTSAVVTIQVGAPLTGPNRKGGGTSKQANAPDHGTATSPTTATGSPDSGAGAVGRAPMDTQRGRRPRVQRGMIHRPAPKPNPAVPPGNLVEGELVSSEVEPAPAQKQAARRGQLSSDGSGGGIPGAAWGILATLGLLGAGALIEARSVLP